MTSLRLPTEDGGLADHVVTSTGALPAPRGVASSRVAFAAAHVVADPLGDNTPGAAADHRLGVDAGLPAPPLVLRFRRGRGHGHRPARHGPRLGDRPGTHPPLAPRRPRPSGARIAAGAGTDQLPAGPTDLETVRRAYVEQVAFVEDAGAPADRHGLAATSRPRRAAPDDYRFVYDSVLSQVSSPVILHWLGPAFDPALAGYWGSDDVASATDAFLDLVIGATRTASTGSRCRCSTPTTRRPCARRLPEGVRLYTGDDFNYPELIRGDGQHHSDALLGIFAAIAPAASEALHALDRR